jgi:hypothetical protein
MTIWAIGASSGGGGGAVNSVGGTAPVESSGGTNPQISMKKATTLVDGYLSAVDFNNFASKAPINSPQFTGAPEAPTAPLNSNSSQIANTAFVTAQIADDAPTKGGGGATGTWSIDISGNAASASVAATATNATNANVALAVDDLNSANVIKQWVGTVAQYNALGSYDPYTYYALTDGETPGGGGGGGTTVAWDDVTGKPSTFPPSAHTHAITDVIGLQSSLDGKLATNGNAASASVAAVATTVDDTNSATNLKFWYGTESQYNAIATKDANTLYFRSA